ncbi:DUF4349 domain-containing protein [Marinitenerispora sediminis]|nr:DUF4349 domain-containing protein [Marinitenerispora sediminis]
MHPSRTARGLLVPLLASLLAGALLAGCSPWSESGSAELAQSAPAPADAPGARDGAAAADAGAAVGADVDVSERTVVHTADMSVRVADVDEAADAAREKVAEAGGYVAGESLGGDGPAGATLSVRVPVDRYEEALDAFGDLGDRLRLERTVEDVTEEVADVESRVASARATLERLRALLDDADNVRDVLAVESEISTRQAELEALQARQQALAGQTAYGTVNLELLPPRTAADGEGSGGFTDGVLAGWAALLAVLRGAATAAGWLLPFLAAAALPGVPAWWLWRRRRRSRSTAEAREAAAESADGPAGDEPAGSPAADRAPS